MTKQELLPIEKEYRILLNLMILSMEADLGFMKEALKKLDEAQE